MYKKHEMSRGFIGLIALLISVMIISLVVVKMDLISVGGNSGPNVIEEGSSLIEKAEELKIKLESKNLVE